MYFLDIELIFSPRLWIAFSFCKQCLLKITDFKQFDYDVPWCGFLLVSSTWGSLSFFKLLVIFIKFEFFKFFPPPSSSSGTAITCTLGFLVLSYSSLLVSSFFFFFFFPSLFFSIYFILIISTAMSSNSLIFFSSVSSLLLARN